MEHFDEVKNDADAASEVCAPHPGLVLVPRDPVEEVASEAEAATADVHIAATVVPGVGGGEDHAGLATVAASAPLASSDEAALDAEAEDLLTRPDLTDAFLESIGRRGLVGERDAALALLASAVTRVQEKPISVVLKGEPAGGKSALCRAVLKYLPFDAHSEQSRVTPAALEALAPELDHKVLFLSEMMAANRAAYALRILISEGKLATTRCSSNGLARTQESNSAVAVWTTTAMDEVEYQLETRLLEIAVDDSHEQTEAVVERMASEAAALPDAETEKKRARELLVWQRGLGRLGPARVFVPHAEGLTGLFKGAPTRARRDFPRLLSLIKGLTLLHQRQRHELPSGALVAADQDVDIALKLWRSRCIGVNAEANTVLDRLLEAFGGRNFTAAEAGHALGYRSDTARRKLNEQVDLGWVERVQGGRGRSGGRWRVMTPSSNQGFGLAAQMAGGAAAVQ
jgi:hypothetical protein